MSRSLVKIDLFFGILYKLENFFKVATRLIWILPNFLIFEKNFSAFTRCISPLGSMIEIKGAMERFRSI